MRKTLRTSGGVLEDTLILQYWVLWASIASRWSWLFQTSQFTFRNLAARITQCRAALPSPSMYLLARTCDWYQVLILTESGAHVVCLVCVCPWFKYSSYLHTNYALTVSQSHSTPHHTTQTLPLKTVASPLTDKICFCYSGGRDSRYLDSSQLWLLSLSLSFLSRFFSFQNDVKT